MKHCISLFFKKRLAPIENKQEELADILTLPVEVALEIAEYLSPVDKACWALCTHGLLATLGGREHYPSLLPGESRDENDLELLLTTLSRDLADHFFCFNCYRLHPSSLVGPPGPAFQPSKRLRCRREEEQARFTSDLCPSLFETSYILTFSHVHLVLKRHWYGPKHGISTESLAFTRIHRKTFGTRVGTHLMSVEARISPNPTPTLCLRTQKWVVMNTTDPSKIFRCAEDMHLCPHLLSALLKFLAASKTTSPCLEIQGYQGVLPAVFYCNYCDVRTQLEIRGSSGEASAVVVTRWMDLGSGIIPPDTEWRFECTAFRGVQLLISSGTGDARSRFESQPGSSLDCLSHRNASLLTGGRYRKEMDPWSLGAWILQGETRLPFLSYVLRRINNLL